MTMRIIKKNENTYMLCYCIKFLSYLTSSNVNRKHSEMHYYVQLKKWGFHLKIWQ